MEENRERGQSSMDKDRKVKERQRINIEETIFLCCDQQQSFSKLIYSFETIVGVAKQLIRAAVGIGIPILATEQNPERLGHLVAEISRELPQTNCETISKMSFSMYNAKTKEFFEKYPHRKTAVLFGAEAHVCILQTTLDMLSQGYCVFLVTDGISSVKQLDRSTTFRRLEAEGACLTTSEAVIFELLRTASHPLFKKLLPVIKMERVQAISKL